MQIFAICLHTVGKALALAPILPSVSFKVEDPYPLSSAGNPVGESWL